MSNEAQLQDGTIIGPYRVDTLVGRGGMAEVYKVWHSGLHRYEALKLLPPAAALDATFVQRFLDEARMAARLHHPHIVTTYAVSEGDGPPFYFSMQLVEGGDLADLIYARRRLAPALAIPLLQQIALALDYAHRHGVIHRDIKPGNILIESDDPLAVHRTGIEAVEEEPAWNVKVVDFGIARALGEGGTTRLTRTGMFMGTPEYMSPEQAGSGAPVDHRTDIYALGIVAYEMLCGRPPFRAAKDTSPLSIVVKHLNEAPPSPREFLAALPEAASAVLLRALAKDPAQRFASCTTFVEALAATTAGMEISKPPSGQGIQETAREEIASTSVAPRAELKHEQAKEPSTPQAPDVPTGDVRVSTLNASLYSLFNKDDETAAAAPPSAFEFPPASAPSSKRIQKSASKKIQKSKPPKVRSRLWERTSHTPSTPLVATAQEPVTIPPVAPPHRMNPLLPTLAVLVAILGYILLGLGWWHSAQQNDAPPAPTPTPTSAPTPAIFKKAVPVPTATPRPTPKPIIYKPAVKITRPLKPELKPQPVHQPVAVQPQHIIRRVRRAPRVETSPPHRVQRATVQRAPRRNRAPAKPKSVHKSVAPHIQSPDAY